jgi:hypothetical protein
VYRGGSWYTGAVNARSASRSKFNPGFPSYSGGFRPARDGAPEGKSTEVETGALGLPPRN